MTKKDSPSTASSAAEPSVPNVGQPITSDVAPTTDSATALPADPSAGQPTASCMDLTQEIRFAVVMYGGASLAIYMNGVAQEMLKLVRATAPDPQDDSKPLHLDESLSGSERVYRKLGKMLSRGIEPDPKEAATIRTRFIIDTLSGTSAGGINAVFLAKALANGQDMGPLRNLWVKEGDIGVLINDKESDKDIKIGVQKPPRSILNSRRMYYELLDALEGMDNPSGQSQTARTKIESSPWQSPYVEALDLYTTATDIWGQVVAMRLADNVAFERRHLNAFHFAYNSTENDFKRENNPFLAFASRCTSAHPAPFEPMKLSDINSVLDRHKAYKDSPDFRSDDKRWRHFFEEYLQHGGGAKPANREERARIRDNRAERFENRPFSDGGVLDNSPFSFALDKLPFRHTKLPVDRKLLYIEPVPQHPERALDPTHPPNAIQNGWLSVSVLPSYQFIRQDLERVLERNRLIERVNRILLGVQQDEMARLERARAKKHAEHEGVADQGPNKHDDDERPLTSYEFGMKTLPEMIERMGSGWGGYQRLRVAETTDELVRIIANAAGFDDETDEFLAIRYLVRAWRNEKYDPYATRDPKDEQTSEGWGPGQPKYSEGWFLYQYDLRWRLRRLRLVLRKVDELSCLDDRAAEILQIANFAPGSYVDICRESPARAKEFRTYLQELKRELSRALGALEDKRNEFLARVTDHSLDSGQSNPLGAAVEAIGIGQADILAILSQPTDKDREAAATGLLDRKRQNFNKFLEALNAELKKVMDDVSARVKGDKAYSGKGILEVDDTPPSQPTPEEVVRATLLYYYENFDRYDMISYPILFSTKVGEETDEVEVFRISPEDAGFLVKDKELRRRKLAGTSISNFGAFFDEEFRTNDILWGRLDSADRLITTLLSSAHPSAELEQVKAELIKDASRAIIAEELSSQDKAGLRALIATSMKSPSAGADNETFLTDLEKSLKGGLQDLAKLREFLLITLKGRDPLDDFTATSKFEHDLPPKTLVRSAARASRVFGSMLEGIADEQRYNRKFVVWVTRVMQLFWGLVEVAVPGSIPNLIFAHWLKLLYLFEFLLVLSGTLFLNQRIQQFGLLIFAVTVVIHAAVKMLGDLMSKKEEQPQQQPTVEVEYDPEPGPAKKKKGSPAWLRALKAALVAGLLLMTLLGLVLLFTVLWADGQSGSPANLIWQKINNLRAWIARDVPNGWNAKTIFRFSIVGVIGLFLLWSVRDDLKGMLRRKRRA